MKNKEAISLLKDNLEGNSYPPFTEIHYQARGEQWFTTISEIPNLISERIIDGSTLVWIEGMATWKPLREFLESQGLQELQELKGSSPEDSGEKTPDPDTPNEK